MPPLARPRSRSHSSLVIPRTSIPARRRESPSHARRSPPPVLPPERAEQSTRSPDIAAWSQPRDRARRPHAHALCFGNAEYLQHDPLPKCVRDAQGVATALRADPGFTVAESLNASAKVMHAAVCTTVDRLRSGDTMFLYFSGHGVGAGGDICMVGVNAETGTDVGRESQSLRLSKVLRTVHMAVQHHEYENITVVVILDCCRVEGEHGRPRHVASLVSGTSHVRVVVALVLSGCACL